MRPSRRAPDEMRPVSLQPGVATHAEGSCLVKFGDTHVLVTASVEEKAPPFLKGSGKGWVTAEYGMLPRATHERTRREAAQGKQSGRTLEIHAEPQHGDEQTRDSRGDVLGCLQPLVGSELFYSFVVATDLC